MSPAKSKRAIVVTGAGTGIGRAIALRLASEGANVALIGRRRANLEETASAATGGATLVLAADVADRKQIDAAFDGAVRAFGPLHAVIANAGIGGSNSAGAGDRWEEILRTNLDG